MAYWIIALIVLFILAPMIRLWPSAKDRQAMEGRRVAMRRGVGVELTQILDPVPIQDKYKTPSGMPIEPKLSVVAFRARHGQLVDDKNRPCDWFAERVGESPSPLAKKKGVKRADWMVWFEEQRMPESKAEEKLVDEVLSVVVAAPKSVVSMDWQNRALSAYWVENGRSEEVEMICDQLESLLEAHT